MPVLGWQYYHFQPEDPVIETWALSAIITQAFFLLKVKSEEIWARDWDRYQGRQGEDSFVKEKDC